MVVTSVRRDDCASFSLGWRRALRGGLVVLSTLMLASSLQAQAGREKLDQAREHMERGQELYLQGKYVESAEAFQRAYDAQPFSAFLYNAAISYERGGRPTEAAQYFSRYLEQEPQARDAADVRGRIEKLRAGAATPPEGGGTATPPTDSGTTTPNTGAAQPSPGTETRDPAAVPREMKSLVAVRTSPEGARVSLKQLDRVVATGSSPFAHTLGEGRYRLVVEHPDYRTVEQSMTVRRGRVYVVIVEMSQGQFLGLLKVTSNPAGANVFVDKKEAGVVGQTPFQNVISTGMHRVWVERPGYQAQQREVEVGVGDEVEVNVPLERVAHGKLRVTANVRGATVYVDDRRLGSVPLETDVPAGAHAVRVEADDMKDWEETVTVQRGQVTPVRVRLRPSVGRAAAWITASAAAVVLAGGITLGVLSSNLRSDLDSERDAGRLASDDPRIDGGRYLAIGADVAFGAAIVLGALSLYYFLRDPLPDSEGRVLEARDWAMVPTRGIAGATVGHRFVRVPRRTRVAHATPALVSWSSP